MSQENVEIVMGLLPSPEVDFVSLFRDDRTAARSAEAIAHQLDEEFEVAIRGMPDGEKTYVGLDGLREFWLDWLAPWTTYRQEVEEAIDLGDRVLLIIQISDAAGEARRRSRAKPPVSGRSVMGGSLALSST